MSKPILYYLNLITSSYRSKPKFISWLTVFLEKVHDITSVLDVIDLLFDIDYATGNQLDILGRIIGQDRIVNFQPSDGSSSILDDATYRTLLKAKIIKNQWKGDIVSLGPLWKILFPDGEIIIVDNQDMTMSAIIAGNFSLIERDLVRHGYIVPKPQSVGLKIYFGSVPFFAYDMENEYFAGYDIGNWAIDKELIIFAYDTNDSKFKGYDQGYWSN